jgi:DNA-binding GntR family transcriptional regulator
MVKENLASLLRDEILSGRLRPGETIVEGKWAAQLKVAQGSIREALNILAKEGFVQKGHGRSARVTKLSDEDVIQICQLRAALESLAARLVAEKKADLSDLEQALSDMRSAAECNNMRLFYERDLHFHMLLCEKSGNYFLAQAVRPIIVPLFAFVIMRVHNPQQTSEVWRKSVEEHRQMLAALKTGDPELAAREVAQMIARFSDELLPLLASKPP